MSQPKYKIITVIYDIRPVDETGAVDFEKISGIQTVLNLRRRFSFKNQKPAKNAGNGESSLGLKSSKLALDVSLAKSKKLSSPKVYNSFYPGPPGNRTPKTRVLISSLSQTGLRVDPSYQKELNPQEDLDKYLNENIDPKVVLASIGAEVHENKNSKLKHISRIVNSRSYVVDHIVKPKYEIRNTKYESDPLSVLTYEIPNTKYENHAQASNELNRWVKDFSKVKVSKLNRVLLLTVGLGLIPLTIFGHYGSSIKNRLVIESNSAVANLETAGNNIKKMDFVSASDNFARAYQEFSKAGDDMNFMGAGISSLLSNLPGAGKLKSVKNLVQVGKLMADAGQAMASAMSEIAKTNLILLPIPDVLGTSGIQTLSIGEISASLKKALTLSQKNLKNAKALLSDVDDSSIPEDKKASFEDFKLKLPFFEKLINDSVDYSKFLEDFIGTQGTKKYLILFQNPSELRPTGGFPGTYGVVSFKDGKLQDFKVDDVYNLDSHLQELIVPPVQLQHITPNWGMRDANWFIDFPTSVRKIISFFKKESGYDVDGVITFSPQIVAKMLDIVGPVDMPEYNLTLDSKNLLPVLQDQVEYKGDRKQPKQIVMDLAPRMLKKLYSAESGKWLKIFSLLLSSMEQKDIFMYFTDLNLESFSADKGFSGQVADTDSDYLMVTFTNVKGSKTDSVMDSALKVATITENSDVKHKVSITRTHNGGGNKYGFYNKQSPTYVRVLVPENAKFVGLKGNSRPNFKPLIDYTDSGFTKDEDLAKFEEESYTDKETGVIIYKEAGKTEFGFWTIINPGETKTVDLEYTVPASNAGYQFYIQKQPGLNISDFKFYMDGNSYYDGPLDKDMVIKPSM